MTTTHLGDFGAPFDFFAVGALATPALGPAQAEAILRDHFGVEGRATGLGSQQDANFLVHGADGEVVGVLKVTNAAWGEPDVQAQEAALAWLGERCPELRMPVSRVGVNGEAIARVILPDGTTALARLGAYVAGGTLNGDGYLRAELVADLGALAGRVCAALEGLDHPALHHVLQWDLQHADRVVTLLAGHVADEGLRADVLERTGLEWSALQSVADRLPRQAIHGDLTDDNVVLAQPDSRAAAGHGALDGRLDGVLDLGDVTHSWAVAELAVTLSSLLHHDGATPLSTLPAIQAFDAQRRLSDDELHALWPLVVLRGAVLVVSGHQQVAVDVENAYAASALDRESQIFGVAASVPSVVMEAAVREALGRPVRVAALPPGHRAMTATAPEPAAPDAVVTLDLGPESDALDNGRWLRDGIDDELARAALDAGAALAVTRFGEARLTLGTPLESGRPRTVATGIDAWWARDTVLAAPWAGRVAVAADGIRLTGDDGTVLHLTGAAALAGDGDLAAGAELVRAPARQRVRVAVADGAALAGSFASLPDAVDPALAQAWRRVLVDPAPLLGAPAEPIGGTHVEPAGGTHAEQLGGTTASDQTGRLLDRRDASFATVQEHYYAAPPRTERGWRHFMVDGHGRPLLDMINNVAVLGHGHPDLAGAVERQWRRLNTNSRFHYASLVEFSERLAGTLPDPLDTVLLVNSGSEANDLALRIAMAATGRRDVVAVREAYHGWTYASDAVSTSVADNPNALTTRPDWVHTVDAPNTYRGTHRGAEAHRYAPEAVAAIDALAAAGRPPAAFISEPYYGNAGGMALPDGYLAAVYAATRSHGGLAIADEVQVGYGRLGEWFWGFEQQGAVPDVVTVAKAMGNGHPLGAVITSREIAEQYRRCGYFFSSAGGSPVSSVVGLTVLDVMQREGLVENARTVGAHLKAGLKNLAARHELIGAVHGSGLYLGVELVRDRESLEPAVEETAAICERMLELGVIIQATSDRQNVLKVKPPLCIDRDGADFFVATLDRVLSRGW